MKQIANDEVSTPFELMFGRTPTHVLRFRDIGSGGVLLEQLWESHGRADPQWVPVQCAKSGQRTPSMWRVKIRAKLRFYRKIYRRWKRVKCDDCVAWLYVLRNRWVHENWRS